MRMHDISLICWQYRDQLSAHASSFNAAGVMRRYTVAFIMPSKYTKMTLPKPENGNVQVGGTTMRPVRVAIKWYGRLVMCGLQIMPITHVLVVLAFSMATGRLASQWRSEVVLSYGRSRRCLHRPWPRCPGGELPCKFCLHATCSRCT